MRVEPLWSSGHSGWLLADRCSGPDRMPRSAVGESAPPAACWRLAAARAGDRADQTTSRPVRPGLFVPSWSVGTQGRQGVAASGARFGGFAAWFWRAPLPETCWRSMRCDRGASGPVGPSVGPPADHWLRGMVRPRRRPIKSLACASIPAQGLRPLFAAGMRIAGPLRRRERGSRTRRPSNWRFDGGHGRHRHEHLDPDRRRRGGEVEQRLRPVSARYRQDTYERVIEQFQAQHRRRRGAELPKRRSAGVERHERRAAAAPAAPALGAPPASGAQRTLAALALEQPNRCRRRAAACRVTGGALMIAASTIFGSWRKRPPRLGGGWRSARCP